MCLWWDEHEEYKNIISINYDQRPNSDDFATFFFVCFTNN